MRKSATTASVMPLKLMEWMDEGLSEARMHACAALMSLFSAVGLKMRRMEILRQRM